MMGSDHREGSWRDGDDDKAQETNQVGQDGEKEVGVGEGGEGQELSQEEDSKINEADEDVNDYGGSDAVLLGHPSVVRNQPQQQPHVGPIVQWERFLPVRSLKVLLVENDDCTRGVVSALLRNCSYEVTAAASGLQAWKILEDLKNRVDLVLTEVVMPGLSGIGLLCKIMNHKTCKNIPVIMMSSNDSMGIVFKCLSKGAVDFLVKPVRKNELKNLWQHVWRRCRSSSTSGSESRLQDQKSTNSNSADDSDNNTGSNDEDEYGSTGMNARGGSDNGSGTQSSWTKHAVELESTQPNSPLDQLAHRQDSTCAQVFYPKPELSFSPCAPMITVECQDQIGLPGNDIMGKDLESGVADNPDHTHLSYPYEKNKEKVIDCAQIGINGSSPELKSGKALDEPATHAADHGIANSSEAQLPKNITEGKNQTVENWKELPSLELSLKRLRSNAEAQADVINDRRVFRCSDVSAFSRYNSSAASNQAPTVRGGSSSVPNDCCSEAVRTDTTYNMTSNSNIPSLKQGSNASSDNNDMGSTTKNTFTNPTAIKEKIPPASTGIITGVQHQLEVQHHHHNYHHHHHHHHHHVHSIQQQQQQHLQLHSPPDHENMAYKTITVAGPPCVSSNKFTGPVEGNAANYSLNGGASGSHHGSNAATDARVMTKDKDNRDLGKIETEGGASGVDQNRSAHREAALNKFRQKRKERNFDKKVRYQSRKKLAEQRPRVRGQFVRQMHQESSGEDQDN